MMQTAVKSNRSVRLTADTNRQNIHYLAVCPIVQKWQNVQTAGNKPQGPGVSLENRVKWSSLSILKDDVQAQPYTVATFIDGEPWLQQIGAPFRLGVVGS
ncbi:Pectinesterase, active site-containing protein [Artemisia annua]|uniref:Pectinesterase, active site-containing protein n=1 Tax=Artemisia annua TaxID=35608 RepID=A0A2U1KDU4_ARTAN|nr:Pectinesterase, active site-containing protein [Artemisia annua]